MLTMRATPKISEKPIASSAYTPPLTSPVTRMSWRISLLLRHLEGLHALYVRRPERHLLAVLPLHRDAGGLADRPHQVVALVPGVDARRADVLHLLDHRHQLVGLGAARLLDRRLEDHDRIVGRRVVGRRLLEALLERAHERYCLWRHLDFGVRVQRRHELRLACSGLPELLLLPFDIDAPGDRLHVALAHLAP